MMVRRTMTFVLSVTLFFNMIGLAHAVKTDSTYVSVSGDILDTPCTIASDSRIQTIDMGHVTTAQIISNGAGPSIAFAIRLIDCNLQRYNPHLSDWQSFAVTFDGLVDGGNFAVAGDIQGLALQLADDQGNIIHPGAQLPQFELHSGNQVLHYTLRLVRNQQPLHEGSYSSVVHFRLNYF